MKRNMTFSGRVLLAAVLSLQAAGFGLAEETVTPAAGKAAPAEAVNLAEMKAQLAAQQKQIEALQKALDEQQKLMEHLSAASAPATNSNFNKIGQVASTTPIVPPMTATTAVASPVSIAVAQAESAAKDKSPLQLKVGETYITPVGFMDFTTVIRSTDGGSGIGTNFGSIPFANTAAGNLSETRLSMQNSRIGLRFDTKYKEIKVLGYLETDFLGNAPANLVVNTNSNTVRSRVFFLDTKINKWEFLGGQSWSLLTPNRKGLSPIPGDIFFTQNIDTNYQIGIPWGRVPGFRILYHANDNVHLGVALENPEQYIGGSSGGSTVTLPTAFASYTSQLNNGSNTSAVPNLHPDIIGKLALEGKIADKFMHFEVAGLLRTFKTYNPTAKTSYTTNGGGFSANFNLELLKNFRFITNNYYSVGGGRYLFGQAPDVVVNADGSVSGITAMGNVTGFEATIKNTLLYAYYGGLYVDRKVVIDPANNKPVGYGFTGSSQNRAIQEGTFGINQTLWKNAAYGAVNLMFQYSYLQRNPWYVAIGTPKEADLNMVFINLRYTLPGSAPTIK